MSKINEAFLKKAKAAYKAKSPEDKAVIDELQAVLSKFDAAFGGYVYKGQPFALMPGGSEGDMYFLIAMQIDTLSHLFGKSHSAILAEVNDALKVIKGVVK